MAPETPKDFTLSPELHRYVDWETNEVGEPWWPQWAKARDESKNLFARLINAKPEEIGFAPSDESILAAASRAGLDVPYSCKSGVCATCRAKLLEGEVRMDRNFALEKAEIAAGFVLTCQAHPLTERVVLSFDER